MKILKKNILAHAEGIKITSMVVNSPHIARKARPGQFVIVMADEKGERIPLTIVDADNNKGKVTLVFQELGLTTQLLGKLKEGDSLHTMAGPLGNATDIKTYGKVILIGGGVGIAEVYPVAKSLKKAGNEITTILGARTKALLILERDLDRISDKLLIATNDGSYGEKGFTTDLLKDLLCHDKYDLIYAVGPIPMMREVSKVSKGYGIKTMVSLNALMVDGTGMCGCCRVTVDKKIRFSCVDGPEFDGHLIDWQELERRNKIYCEKEGHICKLMDKI